MNIIVVEDELYLRKNIIKIINERESQIPFYLFEAKNGLEALELIRTQKLHLDCAFVDIRMPVMNGIQLTEILREESPETDVIFISGYSDFDYARSAIQYRVKGYLLKPLNHDEFWKELSLAVERHLREAELLMKNLMNGLITVENINHNLLDNIMTSYYFIAAYSSETELFKVGTLGLLNADCETFSFTTQHDQEQFVYSICYAHSPEQMRRRREQFDVNQYQVTVQQCLIGNLHHGADEFEETIREMHILFLNRSKEQTDSVLRFADLKRTYCHSEIIFKKEAETLLNSYLLNADFSQIYQMVHHIFAQYTKAETSDLTALQDVYIRFVLTVNDVIHGFNQEHQLELPYLAVGDLRTYYSLEQLCDDLCDSLCGICKQIREAGISRQKHLMMQLKTYIDQHYAEPIIVQEIAKNQLFVHPKYLGNVFYKYMHMSIAEYVLCVRMEASTSLLLSGQFNITEVSERVGFNSPSYFTLRFRQYFGKTPGEFLEDHGIDV